MAKKPVPNVAPAVRYLACKAFGKFDHKFVFGFHWITVPTMSLPEAPGPTIQLPLSKPEAAPQWGLGADGRLAIAASSQTLATGSYRAVVKVSIPEELTPPPA